MNDYSELYLSENDVHDLIIKDINIKDGISNILNIEQDFKLIHEDEYINGITADFTLKSNDKIRAIVEVKGAKINVTDYVRGIGQIFQYEYFYENNITPKSIPYHDTFNTIYIFPSAVIRNNSFNIARFKYPETVLLLEINEKNKAIRCIEKSELEKLASATVENNLVTISQYYFRDNRIFEYYILLNYLQLLTVYMRQSKINRQDLEKNFLEKIGTINNRNWRNAFITLSRLGLINSNNIPTVVGQRLALLDYEEFAYEIYISYIYPYAEQLIYCFEKNCSTMNNQELSAIIRNKFKGRNVLFLTESDGRYISSWLNILRDDYGIFSFEARSKTKILNYNPHQLNKSTFIQKIQQYSIAHQYIQKYQNLIQSKINL